MSISNITTNTNTLPPCDGSLRECSKVITVEEKSGTSGEIKIVKKEIFYHLHSQKVSAGQLERSKAWKKFGDASSDPPGPCMSSTITGDPVTLNLSHGKDFDKEEPAKAVVVEAKSVSCKYCQGPHWSARCPFKDVLGVDGTNSVSGSGSGSIATQTEEKKLKYVSPAQRRQMEQGTAAGVSGMAAAAMGRDNPNTVRLSNLEEITTETDITQLITPITKPIRVYVSKDFKTGLCRGSAFVSFNSMSECEKVVERINNITYGNIVINASIAKPQKP